MTKKAKRSAPIVFISSTVEDLEPFRERAKEAALAAGFYPQMMDYFPVSGRPSVQECRQKVASSQLLIAIVAHRYGWVPSGQPKGEYKSITWLECLEAVKEDLTVLAFLVDEKADDWPEHLYEDYRLREVSRNRKATQKEALKAFQLVQKNNTALSKFKDWLKERHCGFFSSLDDLQNQITTALHKWLDRHPDVGAVPQGDPLRYLRNLREETAYIDIRGLQVGSGKANRFPIEDLYISLQTASPKEGRAGQKGRSAPLERPSSLNLEKALAGFRLAVIGDPGAGKSTFLKRICQLACRGILDNDRKAVQTLGLKEAPFPISIRLSEFHEHRAANKGRSDAPSIVSSPDWLSHFLNSQWKKVTGLDALFFDQKLVDEPVLLLLDGLDEVPTDKDRRSLVKWIEKASTCWEKCRIVVTSRPATYKGEAVLAGFDQAVIEELGDSAVATFLERWCQALFPKDAKRADRNRGELLEALHLRPDIRRMARNPVMLTALAVVHWNEKRLPEQRADLYESILTWLARSREERPRRFSPERCLTLLQALALAMQEHKGGRRVQVSRHWAAEAIASLWRDGSDGERIAAAQKFLDEEEQDSGIVVRRGSELRFWHLTFQEYLAARALAGMGDQEQHQRILKRLYDSEWREVVLLLGGVLHAQGVNKVDNLISAALKRLGSKPTLPKQARGAGLLGAIVRDLDPIGYQPSDSGYQDLLDFAMAVFDPESSARIAIEVAIEAAEALGQAGDPRFEKDQLKENWVEIPAGEFWMGAQSEDEEGENFDKEAYEWESPVHRVHLDAYRVGRYPVTAAEYQRFVQDGGYKRKAHWAEGGYDEWTEPDAWEDQKQHLNRPVAGVSWFEAAAYAHWKGAQLPTEAQWERAARGSEGRKYPWGNRPEPSPQLLNFDESNTGVPTPVGAHPRGSTPDGIADLAGNVWEWCQDRFGDYQEQLQKNPTGPKTAFRRVLRGGAWGSLARFCRSSCRGRGVPTERGLNVGFRVVLVSSSAKTLWCRTPARSLSGVFMARVPRFKERGREGDACGGSVCPFAAGLEESRPESRVGPAWGWPKHTLARRVQ